MSPNAITYTALFAVLERCGRWPLAMSLYCEMRRDHVGVDSRAYRALLRACERGGGEWHEAVELLRHMTHTLRGVGGGGGDGEMEVGLEVGFGEVREVQEEAEEAVQWRGEAAAEAEAAIAAAAEWGRRRAQAAAASTPSMMRAASTDGADDSLHPSAPPSAAAAAAAAAEVSVEYAVRHFYRRVFEPGA